MEGVDRPHRRRAAVRRGGDAAAAGGRRAGQAIPPTLQQSLAARLDRLGEAREVAQIGAVLGREFSYALLASVAAVADRGGGVSDRHAPQAALEKLAEADLLFVEGTPPTRPIASSTR